MIGRAGRLSCYVGRGRHLPVYIQDGCEGCQLSCLYRMVEKDVTDVQDDWEIKILPR